MTVTLKQGSSLSRAHYSDGMNVNDFFEFFKTKHSPNYNEFIDHLLAKFLFDCMNKKI